MLSAATVSGLVSGDPERYWELTAAVALTAGVILVLAGALRLGFVANFFAEPVLVGFLFGMAMIIVIRQLPKLLGVEGGDGNFFERRFQLVAQLPATSLPTLAVGVA